MQIVGHTEGCASIDLEFSEVPFLLGIVVHLGFPDKVVWTEWLQDSIEGFNRL